MSKDNCPKCAKPILPAASNCLHCGHALRSEARYRIGSKRKDQEHKKTVVPATLMMAVIVIGFLIFMRGGGEEDKCGTKIEAWTYAKILVTKRLIAPSTADFGGWDATRISKLECGRWMVMDYVDSQNGFGAMIRTNFSVIVHRTGKQKWELEKIDMW